MTGSIGQTTLLRCLQQAIHDLHQAGIPTPDLDARLLLEAALQKDRAFCHLYPEHELSEEDVSKFQVFVKRRLVREPIAKILGEKEFWSLPFKTTKDTLDPRPDSETLIEAVLVCYPQKDQTLRMLDLGTGTGCLILSLLHEYKMATGVAVDLSAEALAVAQENAQRFGLQARVLCVQSSWLDNVTGTYDVIVSNPPYIPRFLEKTLAPELTFDPQMALYGSDEDGLGVYRLFAHSLRSYLTPQGKIFLEFGQNQHIDVQQIFEAAGFRLQGWHKDLTGIKRCGVFQL